MPPFGQDDKTHAMHVLSVLDCAKAFVAAVSRTGGIEALLKLNMDPSQLDVRDALHVMFTETSKLQVYEARARARGTLTQLDDAQLASAIQDVRQRRVLSAGEQETVEATPETITEMFSLDEPEPVKPAEAPPTDPSKPGDSFSL